MTRKDYRLMADLFKNAHEYADGVGERTAILRLIEGFCTVAKNDNPRFDAAQFKGACGLEWIGTGWA